MIGIPILLFMPTASHFFLLSGPSGSFFDGAGEGAAAKAPFLTLPLPLVSRNKRKLFNHMSVRAWSDDGGGACLMILFNQFSRQFLRLSNLSPSHPKNRCFLGNGMCEIE